jgi:hypothetical protein
MVVAAHAQDDDGSRICAQLLMLPHMHVWPLAATAWRLEAHVCELAQNALALNGCQAHSGHWLQPPGAWRRTFVSSHRMRWPLANALMGARLTVATGCNRMAPGGTRL